MTSKQASSLIAGRRKTTWTVATLVVFAMIGGGVFYWRSSASSQAESGSQPQTSIVRPGDITVTASGSGTLVAQTDASFGFDTSGQVTTINVKVGDPVEAGQVLAQLDSTLQQMKYAEAKQTLQELYSAASIAKVQQEIAAAQDTEFYAREWLEYLLSPEVLEAEDNLTIAQQKLEAAQAEAAAHPSDAATQAVKEKEQAVAYLTDQLHQAQEYYKNTYLPENFGEYENIGSRRRQHMVLVTYVDPYTGEEVPEINGPSAADIATARNNYIQAQETVQEGETYLETLNTGTIPDDATGEKVNTLYQAQLAVESAQTALDDMKLIAPISGTVTSLDLNVGEQAGTSSVITIAQLNQPYTIDAYIEESDWDLAKAGNKVNVTFDLLPGQTFAGTVTTVYPELSPSFETDLVHLIVQLDSSISQALPAGTGATVNVVGGEAKGVLLVSVDAIHEGDDGRSYVTVLQMGQQVEREVQIGLSDGTNAEIRSGLDAGEIVVTE